MDGNAFFHAVTLAAGAVFFAVAVSCLFPKLRHPAKQGLFVGFIGGLLSLSLLSVIFIYQLTLFPWLAFGFFGLGFALFSGCYFGTQLLGSISRRGSGRA